MMRLKRPSKNILTILLLSISLISALAPLDFQHGRLLALSRLRTDMASSLTSLTEITYRAGCGLRSLGAILPHLNRADELIQLREQVAALEARNKKLIYTLNIMQHKQRNLAAFKSKFKTEGSVADIILYERPGRVVASEPALYRRSIRINLGRAHGVSEGCGVLWHDAVVGRVVTAGRTASVVNLLTDPDFRAIAKILCKGAPDTDSQVVEGIIEGTLTGKCRMKYVPLESKVSAGDVVYASGQFGFFPPGSVIGRVANQPTNGNDGFLSIEVDPFIRVERLLTVVVAVPADGEKVINR